ncbi:hypothetical protein M9H77_28849 [Catharanthus roseus]|uniref:Uncharacterized protein n=1 Tax=Catharanthus roseus TaxID=4058 RepID=A0ACC0AH45_CATRO|nr:hypothetical protein M9H77_28849 [Catharanthus roseus]
MACKVNIPQDALTEILLRLPVKSLIRFKCVSKSWFSLLTSPLFIDMHLKFSLTRDDEFVLIKSILNDDKTHQTLLSLHIDDESLSVLVPRLEILSFINESLGIKPLNYDFPELMATRQIRIIPPHPPCPEDFLRIHACWEFGFYTATDDYKIVIISRIHWSEWAPYILSLDINTEVFYKFGYPKTNKTSSDERY